MSIKSFGSKQITPRHTDNNACQTIFPNIFEKTVLFTKKMWEEGEEEQSSLLLPEDYLVEPWLVRTAATAAAAA